MNFRRRADRAARRSSLTRAALAGLLLAAACDPSPAAVVAEPEATTSAEASGSIGSNPPASSLSKKDGCAALVSVINTRLEQLETIQQRPGADPSGIAELRAMATVMDQAASSTGKLSLGTPEPKALALRYQAMARDIAKHARGLADAAEKKDLDELGRAQKALNAALKLEDPIVDELNAFCAE